MFSVADKKMRNKIFAKLKYKKNYVLRTLSIIKKTQKINKKLKKKIKKESLRENYL